MKNLLLWVLLFSTSHLAVSQISDQELQKRYFDARNRLKKYFVTIGKAPGESLPLEEIRLKTGKAYELYKPYALMSSTGADSFLTETQWKANYENFANGEPEGLMQSDNPLITHGEYLAVLATEWWLYKHYGQQNTPAAQACKNEMYYALAALDRLDRKTENYFNENNDIDPSDVNGFLMRDDIPIKRNEEYNKYYGFKASKYGELRMTGSHYEGSTLWDTLIQYWDTVTLWEYDKLYDSMYIVMDSSVNPPQPDTMYKTGIVKTISRKRYEKQYKFYRNKYKLNSQHIWTPQREDGVFDRGRARRSNEPSVDEIIGIFVGLKYLQKFVGEEVWAKPLTVDSAKYLISWSRDIAHRIMTYLSKTTTDIRFYDDEAYEENQKIACAKDKNCKDAISGSFGSKRFDPAKCPECAKREVYTKYVNEMGKGQVYNPKIISSANYVLSNPENGNRPVRRGSQAFPYGYPLEKLGEQLASGNGVNRDYPGVSVELSANGKIITTAARIPARFGSYAIVEAVVFARFADFFGDAKNLLSGQAFTWDWNDAFKDITLRCPLAFSGLDGMSTCLTGRLFEPNKPEFWEAVWKKMGQKGSNLNEMLYGAGRNAGSANVMSAKLAALTGTWSQSDFKDFAKDFGFELMSLQYDVLNDKYPALNQQYYKSLLAKMDCQGHQGSSWPFDRDALSGNQMKPELKDVNLSGLMKFTGNFGYMLYHNLYRIAQIKHWGDTIGTYMDNSCPCHLDTFKVKEKLMVSAIEPDYLVSNFPPGSAELFNIRYDYRNKKNQITSLVKTKEANPLHKRYNIHQPEYLNHNYKVNNNQMLEVTRDLVVCNSLLSLENGSTLQIDSSSVTSSPNEVRIRNNGQIWVKNGATIVVNNHSRLIIEATGTLFVENGATIVLNGPEAVLQVKGKLQLGQNLTFKVVGGTRGLGYIIWENGNLTENGKATLIANASNTVELTSNYAFKTILKVKGTKGFVTGKDLGNLYVHHCMVEEDTFSQIHIQNKKTIWEHVEVRGNPLLGNGLSPENNPTSYGIAIEGTKNMFRNVSIKHCETGITAINVTTPFVLNLYNCFFDGCRTKVRNYAGGMNMYGCSLGTKTGENKHSWINVSMFAAATPNYITNSTLDMIGTKYNNFGQFYNVLAQGPGRMNLINNLVDNGTYNTCQRETRLYNTCNTFRNAKKIAHLLSNAELFENYLAWNHINQSGKWVSGSFGDNILSINNGQNFINGATSTDGTFITLNAKFGHLKKTSSPINSNPVNNSNALMAERNFWNSANPFIPAYHPVNYTTGYQVKLAMNGVWPTEYWDLGFKPLIFLTSPNVNTSQDWLYQKQNNCLVYAPNSNLPVNMRNLYPKAQFGAWDENTGVTGGNGNPLLGALVLPPNPIPTEFNATQTMMQVHESWFDVAFPTSSMLPNYQTATQLGIWLTKLNYPVEHAYNAYNTYKVTQDMYYSAIADTVLADTPMQVLRTALFNDMSGLQNTLVAQAAANHPVWKQFEFELHRDRALLLRSANQRQGALTMLNTMLQDFARPSQIDITNMWICIINKEMQYINQEIDYKQLTEWSCNNWMESATDTIFVVDSTFENYGGFAVQTNNKQYDGLAKHKENNYGAQQVKVEQSKTATLPLVYPNPTAGTLHILAAQGQTIQQIELYNLQGKRIVNKTANNNKETLQINTFAEGIYVLHVTTNKGTFKTKVILAKTE